MQVIHDHLQKFFIIDLISIIISILRVFHINITFTHLLQSILYLFKSKIRKSTPLNIG
jgi:hypothetical protein